MQFERVTPKDIVQITNLQPKGWSDITVEYRFFLSNSFCNPIKMIVDDRIVGVGNTITFKDTAWLAHIIVGNEHRNRGFGFRIVEHLLNDLTKSIKSISLIASPFGEPVYKKIGFKTVSDYIYLERRDSWNDRKISERIVRYESKYYREIIRLDKEISGEEREPLIKKYIESSFVYIKADEIKGFYIPTLGEGLIFADTTEAGVELMSMKYAKVDTAVIPRDNQTGLDFLEQNGFCESETKGKRMIVGKEIDWQPAKIFSRISGDYG